VCLNHCISLLPQQLILSLSKRHPSELFRRRATSLRMTLIQTRGKTHMLPQFQWMGGEKLGPIHPKKD
jgi:hypothetical protein